MKLKQQLSQAGNYMQIPRFFFEKLGTDAALILSHFIDCEQMLGQIFFQQRERLQKTFGMTRRRVELAISLLIEKNLIVRTKHNGMWHYSLVHDRILDLQRSSEAKAKVTGGQSMVTGGQSNGHQRPKQRSPEASLNKNLEDKNLEDNNNEKRSKDKSDQLPIASSSGNPLFDADAKKPDKELDPVLNDFLEQFQQDYNVKL